MDKNTAAYALVKGMGDQLIYTDENGDDFPVEIVGMLSNSILQGRILISEERFIEKFPSSGGYKTFLIDAEPGTDIGAFSELLPFILHNKQLSIHSRRKFKENGAFCCDILRKAFIL